MIKKSIYYLLLLTLLAACEAEETKIESLVDKSTKAEVYQPSVSMTPANIEKGIIRVKLSSSAGDNISFTRSESSVQSSVSQLNKLLSNVKASKMTRLFPNAGKYEGRTRREGLHLWYTIIFDKDILVENVISEAKGIAAIEIAEEVYRLSLPEFNAVEVSGTTPSAGAEPFNDPLLNQQWHYNNRGAFSKSIKGADINLYKAWTKETGKPDVIVAVVDGGIDYTHEDLKESMHINLTELNGTPGVDDDNNGYVDDIYGYNFVTRSGEVTFDAHGTHVAGTVAARNNNSIGVSGVAGGNGTPESGVRLISCQMFKGKKSGSSAGAIKYGADNGAVISQNSWGYPYPGTGAIRASDKAAIDYFIKYAGCDDGGKQLINSPMKGGIVIFAAGNDNKDFLSFPSAYNATVAVSSMAPNFKKAWYSNQGDWVDIMAPGGDEYFPKGMVLSTTPSNKYAYMQGTSMACPHVSGVAALIVSKLGGQGFTNDELRRRLLTSLKNRDINAENPKYKNRLGAGYIDAEQAMAENENKKPGNPTFITTVANFTSIELKWKAVADEDDNTPNVYKLYYGQESLDNGNYMNADHLEVSALGYKEGATVSYLMEKLPLDTKYYFAIQAIDRWGLTSDKVDFISEKTKKNNPPVIKREDNTLIRVTGTEKASLQLIVEEPDGQDWKYKVEGYQKGVSYKRDLNKIILDFRVINPLGKYTLKVIVTDPFGATGEIEVPFEYYKNEPPKLVKKFEKMYIPINKPCQIDLSKHFTDKEEKPITYTVKSGTAILKTAVSNNILTITTQKLGLGNIEIIATDAENAKTKTSIMVQSVKDDIIYVIYPIPVKKILNVRLSNEVNKATLTIRTVTGSSVLEKQVNINADNRLVTLDVSDLSGGTYVLYAEANGKTFQQSFIKY